MPVSFLGIYLPQAGRPEEEGELIAKQVDKEIRKWKAKGPLYILGDMNARIQRAEGGEKRNTLGNIHLNQKRLVAIDQKWYRVRAEFGRGGTE